MNRFLKCLSMSVFVFLVFGCSETPNPLFKKNEKKQDNVAFFVALSSNYAENKLKKVDEYKLPYFKDESLYMACMDKKKIPSKMCKKLYVYMVEYAKTKAIEEAEKQKIDLDKNIRNLTVSHLKDEKVYANNRDIYGKALAFISLFGGF